MTVLMPPNSQLMSLPSTPKVALFRWDAFALKFFNQKPGVAHPTRGTTTHQINIMKIEINPSVKKAIRAAVRGEYRTISIGRSRHTAGAGTGTPIIVVEGDAAPTLEGLPYLKTNFSKNGFSKTLYTASTLKIVVGAEWIALQA